MLSIIMVTVLADLVHGLYIPLHLVVLIVLSKLVIIAQCQHLHVAVYWALSSFLEYLFDCERISF